MNIYSRLILNKKQEPLPLTALFLIVHLPQSLSRAITCIFFLLRFKNYLTTLPRNIL